MRLPYVVSIDSRQYNVEVENVFLIYLKLIKVLIMTYFFQTMIAPQPQSDDRRSLKTLQLTADGKLIGAEVINNSGFLRVCINFHIYVLSVMLWSQMIYGHRTASISPKIVRFYGGRRNRSIFYQIFRHRTVPGEVKVLLKIPRRPYGVW